MVGHRPAALVEVATLEEDSIVTRTAVHRVDKGGDEGLVASVESRQQVRHQLERVIAILAEQQVWSLSVVSTGQDVIARPTEDPVLSHASLQLVVSESAQENVLADLIFTGGEVDDDGFLAGIQDEVHGVDRGHHVGRVDSQQVRRVRG